jgi:hypothetical protein
MQLAELGNAGVAGLRPEADAAGRAWRSGCRVRPGRRRPAPSPGWLRRGIRAGGLAAVALIKVRRDPGDGRLVTIARWPYAAVWTLALVLRLGFAYGSAHWFTRQIASFSAAHHVPTVTYGTAFVIMVLTMITVRTIAVIIRGRAAGATISFQDLRLTRRLAR